MTMVIKLSQKHSFCADVAHGLAVCEVGGTLTGGLLLLLLGPVATAITVAALHLAAWLAGAALLRRFRCDFAAWQRHLDSVLFVWHTCDTLGRAGPARALIGICYWDRATFEPPQQLNNIASGWWHAWFAAPQPCRLAWPASRRSLAAAPFQRSRCRSP